MNILLSTTTNTVNFTHSITSVLHLAFFIFLTKMNVISFKSITEEES